MANQSLKPTHAIPPEAQLEKALSRIGAEIEERPLKSSSPARIMRERLGGIYASGAWDWRMAEVSTGNTILDLKDWMAARNLHR